MTQPKDFVERIVTSYFRGLTPGLFCHVVENGAFAITDQGSILPTLEEMERIIERIYRFYDATSPEEIEAHNQERLAELLPSERREPRPKPERVAKPGYIYLIRASNDLYKIGRSINVANRLRNLQTSSATPLTLVHSFPSDDMEQAESRLHTEFAYARTHGEWFLLSVDDVNYITSLETL